MIALLLIALLQPPPVAAGNRVGNGGDVLDCKTPAAGRPRLQLLDFYEAKERGTQLVTADADASHQQILMRRIELLTKVAPKLAETYRRRAATIGDELGFRAGVALTDVKDSAHAALPAGEHCRLRQIVIRLGAPAPGEKRFVVDRELWDRLDPLNRAGLILHEIVYEHLVKLGESDSRRARQLNARLFAADFEQMTSGKFWVFINELGLPIYP